MADDGDWQQAGFGLYVHWPFCAAKCPYCDFNSHVAATIDHRRWREAYVAEIGRLGQMAPGRRLDSIFFGGGTPSLMEPDTVAAVIDAARATWSVGNALEITLEANPTSVEIGRFRDFAGAGISRVSLGVQSLRDGDLRALGRMHDGAEARKAWDVANAVFQRTSLDIIYARQHQTLEDWRTELGEVLAMGARHLSLYQLTIEPGTVFDRRASAGQLRGLPSETLGADLYDLTQELCDAAGLSAYEVSNHALPGEESRHNLVYWRSGDFAGVGPGAHGRLTVGGSRFATVATRAPELWLRQTLAGDGRQETRETLSHDDIAAEYLMMGLRLSEGVDLRRWRRFSGRTAPDAIDALIEDGLLWLRDDWLGTTEKGRPVLDWVLSRLG